MIFLVFVSMASKREVLFKRLRMERIREEV